MSISIQRRPSAIPSSFQEGQENLTDKVLIFINSSIAYLKIQIADTVKDYVDLDSVRKMTPSIGIGILMNQDAIIDKNRCIFEQIEYYNRKIHLLTVIKKHLHQRNANAVLELITNEKYLSHSEKHIHRLLEAYTAGAMRQGV